MRPIFIIVLMAAIVFSGAQWYISSASVCPIPLRYTLGTYDERFAFTRDEIETILSEAEDVWEVATARELFTADPTAPFTINFIFDERQELAETEATLRSALDAQEAESERVLASVRAQNETYQRERQEHEVARSSYEARLDAYNQTVEEFNEQSESSSEAFAELQKEQQALARERDEINRQAARLNQLIEELNAEGERGNQLIEAYNVAVLEYNAQFGELNAFTQGEYLGDRINIYKYKDREELLTVLVHEFGHALGIGHVEGEEAIMYYLMGKQPSEPVLAAEDLEAFAAVCGSGEEFSHVIRAYIRNILESININLYERKHIF